MRYMLLMAVLVVVFGCSPRSVKKSVPKKAKPAVAKFSASEQRLITAINSDDRFLYPQSIVKGDVGFFASPILVFQVQGDGIFLGRVDGELLAFGNMDTSSLPDGRILDPDGFAFECVGTVTYGTAAGAQRTVMGVKAFDPVRALETVKEAKRIRERQAKSTEK